MPKKAEAVGLSMQQWDVEAECRGGQAQFTLYGPSPQSIERVVASFRDGPRAVNPRWVSTTAQVETLPGRTTGNDRDLLVRFRREATEWEIAIGKGGRAVATETSLTSAGVRVSREHQGIAHPSR
jgi:hypothetical protein